MRKEITCHMFGDEERELAASCGDAGITFLRKTIPGIPHEDYRVLVLQKALKANPRPTTKDFARAQLEVDRALSKSGLGIVIPGARPGRVTR